MDVCALAGVEHIKEAFFEIGQSLRWAKHICTILLYTRILNFQYSRSQFPCADDGCFARWCWHMMETTIFVVRKSFILNLERVAWSIYWTLANTANCAVFKRNHKTPFRDNRYHYSRAWLQNLMHVKLVYIVKCLITFVVIRIQIFPQIIYGCTRLLR